MGEKEKFIAYFLIGQDKRNFGQLIGQKIAPALYSLGDAHRCGMAKKDKLNPACMEMFGQKLANQTGQPRNKLGLIDLSVWKTNNNF